MARDRAVFFIDGNNWYHSLGGASVERLGDLCYRKICTKLAGGRNWVSTRYYIGRVTQQAGNSKSTRLYADQRRFVQKLEGDDRRISVHYGRLEPRPGRNPLADELLDYLANLRVKIDRGVFHDLHAMAKRNATSDVFVEKAVDVMLAVDLVLMAERDEFDAAYVLSADGDYTPAVEAVRSHGKRVYAASCAHGARLAAAVNSFIRLEASWFHDCYR